MSDITAVHPAWSKRMTGGASFVAWFRRVLHQPRSMGAAVLGEAEPKTPRAAFSAWGLGVWRSLKLRGVRDRDLEDALQDVFLVVFSRWESFRGESSRKTWVFGIVHGVVANYHRKNRRAAAEPALVGDEAWCNMPATPSTDPAARSAARQQLEVLATILGALREEDRALFVLHHVDGSSVSEAAHLLGMSLSLASGRLLAAEKIVNAALARHQARDTWRLK